MPRLLRSRRLACLTLAAFLIAQPVVGCALLCLADNHSGLHEMVGMTRSAASGNSVCHTGIESATPRGPAQTLSFMEPAGEQATVRLSDIRVHAPVALPTATPQIAPSLDPPPPRLV